MRSHDAVSYFVTIMIVSQAFEKDFWNSKSKSISMLYSKREQTPSHKHSNKHSNKHDGLTEKYFWNFKSKSISMGYYWTHYAWHSTLSICHIHLILILLVLEFWKYLWVGSRGGYVMGVFLILILISFSASSISRCQDITQVGKHFWAVVGWQQGRAQLHFHSTLPHICHTYISY